MTIILAEYRHPDDYEAVTALWTRSGLTLYPVDAPAVMARTVARNPGLFLLLRDGDALVGAVLGTDDGRQLWVHHLAVDPAYRGQGLATRLMRELADRARERGIPVMMLLVARDNTTAIRLYEKLAWLAVPEILFMVRPLTDNEA